MSEWVAKLRAERHKFYDALLQKILDSPKVRENIEENKEDTEWNKEHGWTDYNFEQNAIENFFEGDEEAIFRVEEIWNEVKEAVKGKVEDALFSPKDLIARIIHRKIDDIVNDTLDEIAEELRDALERKWKKAKSPLNKIAKTQGVSEEYVANNFREFAQDL